MNAFERKTAEYQGASDVRPFKPEERARALIEALPYIRRFRGSVVVIKYGGHAMRDAVLADSFARDMVLVSSVGIRPVVVHGGGPQIAEMLAKLGKRSEFRNGLRVTDAETLDVVRMVLVGKVGRDIVRSINAAGGIAVGISGEDGGLITASPINEELGFVGNVTDVRPRTLYKLLSEEVIPVVSSIGTGVDGQAYNINADMMASVLAGVLKASKVVYLTDVPGLMSDKEDYGSVISKLTVDEVQTMVNSEMVSDGMIPKAQACVDAVRMGAGSAHMLDGRIPHAVLLELFTDAGIGTMITEAAGKGVTGMTTTGAGTSGTEVTSTG